MSTTEPLKQRLANKRNAKLAELFQFDQADIDDAFELIEEEA